MRLKHLLCALALAAGITVGCTPPDETSVVNDKLTVSPASQKIARDGSAVFTFTITLTKGDKVIDLKDREFTATIKFEATGGSVSPASATTDENGQVTVTFTTTDPEGFKGGTVKGTVKKVEGKDAFQQGNLATATAEVLSLDAEDQPISKAEGLKENTYVVQKKGGQPENFSIYKDPDQTHWYVGHNKKNPSLSAIKAFMVDEVEKPDGSGGTNLVTNGMGWFEIPVNFVGKVITINNNFLVEHPEFSAEFSNYVPRSERESEVGGNISIYNGQTYGNIKLDGSSQVLLKEKSGPRGYTGQYTLLFVLSFINNEYDPATGSMVAGSEYTIYGNATLDPYTPKLDYVGIHCQDNGIDWVKVGGVVTLAADWTDGCEFDWNQVTMEENSYFKFSAKDHTVTSIKSNNNQDVTLRFSYPGVEHNSTLTIATGDGWNYTSFTLSPEYMVMEKWNSLYVENESYAPTNLAWDWDCLEIDPASDPNGDFGWDAHYRKIYCFTAPVGNYELRLRVRSNHDVGYKIPIKVVEKVPYSFTITFLKNNTYTTEGHGVCNYGMGLSLGVITNPEDAYWNWSDVELVPYAYPTFTFSGVGGRDDHPKLHLIKSSPSGETSYGAQVSFRLKYNHDKTSTIYVDHN